MSSRVWYYIVLNYIIAIWASAVDADLMGVAERRPGDCADHFAGALAIALDFSTQIRPRFYLNFSNSGPSFRGTSVYSGIEVELRCHLERKQASGRDPGLVRPVGIVETPRRGFV